MRYIIKDRLNNNKPVVTGRKQFTDVYDIDTHVKKLFPVYHKSQRYTVELVD